MLNDELAHGTQLEQRVCVFRSEIVCACVCVCVCHIQIVGLVDTGVDLDSCYLWDPNYVDYQDGNSTFYVSQG